MNPRDSARSALDALGLLGAARVVRWRARRLSNAAFDWRLGVDTTQTEEREDHVLPTCHRDDIGYEPTSYLSIVRCMRRIEWSRSDVFFDVGCGAGRVVCMAARRPIRRCVGIEFDAARAARAIDNASRLRRKKAPIEIVRADAVDADYSSGTIYFFFNPFGEATLRAVMSKVERSRQEDARKIQLVYVNSEHASVLERCSWLRRYDCIMLPVHGETTFWRSVEA